MPHPRPTLRAIAAFIFRYTGILSLWRWSNRDKVIILAIHGTGDPEIRSAWKPLRQQLPGPTLTRILHLLAPHYTFVSMDEAIAMLTGGASMKRNAIVVTFDDGYRNNITNALPILKRFGIHPMIFLATGYVDARRPHWFDRLDYALQSASADGRAFVVGGVRMRVNAGSREALAASYARMRSAVKAGNRDDRQLLCEVAGIAGALETETVRRLSDFVDEDHWSALLGWNEIRTVQHAVDFGSHTVDHIRVGKVPREVGVKQVRDSKLRLEQECGCECRYFAYPDGDYSSEAKQLCREAGYRAAVTMDPGLNSKAADLMALKRIAVPISGSDSEFLADLSGFWNWLRG